MEIRVIRDAISRDELRAMAKVQFGDLVKAVVDLERGIMAIGGELHSDEEAVLLDQGSGQQHLWGINLYPDKPLGEWIEFDSMINVRPSQGNRSRNVESPEIRDAIATIVNRLVRGCPDVLPACKLGRRALADVDAGGTTGQCRERSRPRAPVARSRPAPVLAGLRARLGTSRSHDRRSAMERTPERTRPLSGIRLRGKAGRGRLRQRPGGLGPLFLRLCRVRTGPSLTPPFSAEPARHCLHTQVVDSRSPLIPQTGSIAIAQDYRLKEGSFKRGDCSIAN